MPEPLHHDVLAMTDFPLQYAQTRRFTLGAPRTIMVSPDGTQVLFLRSHGPTDPILCLWRITKDRGEHLLVDPAGLEFRGEPTAAELARRERARESAGGIVQYSVDQDFTIAAFTLGGDLYVVDLNEAASSTTTASSRTTASSSTLEPHSTTQRAVPAATVRALPTGGGVFDPVVSPDGSLIAFVSEGDHQGLWVIDPRGSDPAQLLVGSHDPLHSWGKAEFIAAEEMGRSRGFWWSPDSSAVLAQSTSEHAVEQWWIGDPAHPDRTPRPIRYPAAGTTNATVELFLFDVNGLMRTSDAHMPRTLPWATWVAPDEGSTDSSSAHACDHAADDAPPFEYLANVVWSAGHNPLIVRQTRDQRTVEIIEWPNLLARNGDGLLAPPPDTDHTPRLRRRITDPVWVELIPGSPTWAGDQLLTVEDSATHRRIVVEGRALDHGSLHVRAILRATTDLVEFTATPAQDPASVGVYRQALDGRTPPVALIDTPGIHSVSVRGATTVTTSLLEDQPGTHIDARFGDAGHRLTDLSAHSVAQPQPIWLRLGPDELNAVLFLPPNHDGESMLPVLLDPYGGPHAQRVTRSFNAHTVSAWFAEQGLAVLVVDGRGTPGRGPQFERLVSGDLAHGVLSDQLAGLEAAAEQFPFLDLGRVGIRGWSFGGYLAALAALEAPHAIHAAVAGAPVTDWRLYDTHYTERYLGHPGHNDHPYASGDLTAIAHKLERPLLIIHGLADDNVVAAHSLRLSTALLAAGRPHEVLPLSGVTHMTPQESVAENLLRLQAEFLMRHLGPQ